MPGGSASPGSASSTAPVQAVDVDSASPTAVPTGRGGSRSSRGRARRRARAAEAAAASGAAASGPQRGGFAHADPSTKKVEGRPVPAVMSGSTRGPSATNITSTAAAAGGAVPDPEPSHAAARGLARGGSSRARSKGESRARARADMNVREKQSERERERELQRVAQEEEARAKEEQERLAAAVEAREREAAERAAAEEALAAARATREKAARRRAERDRNLAFVPDDRPSESELRRLESSLKKCTGFVRKISFSGHGGSGGVGGGMHAGASVTSGGGAGGAISGGSGTTGVTPGMVSHSGGASLAASSGSSLSTGAQAGSALADESLLRECRLLNLTRYISEVVAAIADARVRASEAEGAARLCGELHRRYEDFGGLLVSALTGVASSVSRETVARRSALRLLVELVAVGVITDHAAVFAIVKEAMKGGRGSSDEELANMSVVAVFAKTASRVFLSVSSRREASERRSETSSEFVDKDSSARCRGGEPDSNASRERGGASAHDVPVGEDDPCAWEDAVLPASAKGSMTSTLQTYLREVSALLASTERNLKAADTAALVSRVTRGVDDEAAIAGGTVLKKQYDRIFAAACAISEALGREPPQAYVFDAESVLVSAAPGREGARIVVGAFGTSAREKGGGPTPSSTTCDVLTDHGQAFETDEELAFYKDLPSLDAEEQHHRSAGPKTFGDGHGAQVNTPERSDGAPLSGADDVGKASHAARASALTASSHCSLGKKDVSEDAVATKRSKTPSVVQTGPVHLDVLLSRLYEVDNMEAANVFVAQFCALTSSYRFAVKRLTRVLTQVSSHMLNVVPICARVATSLRPRFPEIASTVSSSVEEELRQLIHRTGHDEKSVASYIRSARYFGEFVKFEVISANEFFDLLGLCVKDFTGHKIDIVCHMLESCGRFLYRTPTTSVRMGNFLDTIWRLKSVRNLEARHNALVESAFFACRPRSSSQGPMRKRLDPIREYVRWRVYSQLRDANVEWTVTHLRKLPWNKDLEQFVVSLFLDVCCMRFSMLHATAKLLAGLSRDRNSLGIAVCDGALEAVIVGLERNDGRDSQRRVAEVMFLGELFNCGMLHPSVVFQVLYQFITFGHAKDQHLSGNGPGSAMGCSAEGSLDDCSVEVVASQSPNYCSVSKGGLTSVDDNPGDFFRLRLTCALLDTCGVRLASPSSTRRFIYRRQLEVFWIYFERYSLMKALQAGLGNRLPLYVEHIVADTYESVILPLRGGESRDTLLKRGLLVTHKARSDRPHFLSQVERDSDKTDDRGVRPSDGCSPLLRASTLDEAIAAVRTVESDPADASCVILPQRVYNRQERSQSLTFEASVRGGSDARQGELVSALDIVDGEDDSEEDTTVNGNCSELSSNDGVSLTSDMDVDKGISDVDEYVSSETEDIGDDDDEQNVDGDANVLDDDDDDEVDYGVASTLKAKTEEEDEFEKELAAVMASDIHSAKVSFTGHSALDRMAIPIGLMAKHDEMERLAATAAAVADVSQSDGAGNQRSSAVMRRGRSGDSSSHPGEPTITFKMLVRRGGKSQIRDLAVPSESALAVATKESESQGEAAHEEVKRLVLGSSTIINGAEEDHMRDEDMLFDMQAASRRKERSISEQRAADEKALLSTLFKGKLR